MDGAFVVTAHRSLFFDEEIVIQPSRDVQPISPVDRVAFVPRAAGLE